MSNAIGLLENTIEFRFYAAKVHLDQLRKLYEEGKTPHNPEVRIKWGILAEAILWHIMGAFDALLVRMNKKLNLNLNAHNVKYDTVNRKLEDKKMQVLLEEVNDLLNPEICPDSWLYVLRELRNIVTHRGILNFNFSINTDHVTIVGEPECLDPIPYFEERIQNMKQLIARIINKEPLLSET